jgi:tetratricopeptide (TPR) repeat protein
VISLRAVSLADRVAGALTAYLAYLRQTLWPAGLAVYYPHTGWATPAWQVLAAALALSGATAAVVLARRRPWLAVGWLWYLVTLVPVIGVVQAGLQARADRYTYLPLVGVFLAAAWEAANAVRGRRAASRAAVAAAVLAVLGCAVAARIQLGRWRDPETLLSSAIAATGENWLAQLNLGVSLLDQRRPAEAIGHLEEAARLQPFYADAYYNLGLANAALGRHREAADLYAWAARLRPSDPDTWNNLGTELDTLGRYEEAVDRYREAVRLRRDFAAAHENLARTLLRLGRREEALAALEESRRLNGAAGARTWR